MLGTLFSECGLTRITPPRVRIPLGDTDPRRWGLGFSACVLRACLLLLAASGLPTDLRVNLTGPFLHARDCTRVGAGPTDYRENTSKPGKHFGVTQGASGVAAIAAAPFTSTSD